MAVSVKEMDSDSKITFVPDIISVRDIDSYNLISVFLLTTSVKVNVSEIA